jgi:hypothetical protein
MRPAYWVALLLIPNAGCAVVADLDTSGYQPVDAGNAHDAACDAKACLDFECLGAGDCPSGWVCCLSANSATSASFACDLGPVCSAPLSVQLCRTDGECGGNEADAGDGGPTCIHQRCSLGGGTVEFEACGTVPGCSR